MDDIYGIIPVSKFKECKTRLSPFLSEEERENLLKVMLKDVTDTLRKYTDKIIIISADEDVLKKIKRGFFIEQKQERNPLPLSEA